jgi:single-strand DNA-binding protein
VANISLATTESFKNKSGEKEDKTEWHNLIFWNKLAEIVGEYVSKGSLIYVEGKIETREYEGNDGVTRKKTSIVCFQMKMLSGNHKKKEEGSKPDEGMEGFYHEEE